MQYRTTTPIKHNGTRFTEGELLDLSDAEAQQLLELGAIEPVDMPFSGQLKKLGGES